MNRRGVTTIELVIASALLGLIAVLTSAVLRGMSASVTRAVTRAAAARSASAASSLFRHDVRRLQHADMTPATGGVSYHRSIGTGVACTAAANVVTVARDDWSGGRLPVAGTDLARTVDHPDSSWNSTAITSVSGGSCPDGRPAITVALGAAPLLPVVEVVEPVRAAVYASAGKQWLGLAIGSAVIQPLAGPVTLSGWVVTPAQVRARLGFGASDTVALDLSLP